MADDRLRRVAADAACFVCGPSNPIGLQVRYETDRTTSSSSARLTLTAEYQGWKEVVHGGIVSALLDEACIYACRTKAEQCVTAELTVRFKKPVAVGSEVLVHGHLDACHGRIWQASARLTANGILHAEAFAKVYILKDDDKQ